MIKIQQKIKTDEYDDADDLQADLELLINNAKSFYKVNCLLICIIDYKYFRLFTTCQLCITMDLKMGITVVKH